MCLVRSFLSDSDCETVKPQSFPVSRKRRAFHFESKGDMHVASSAEDAQQLSRRRTQEVVKSWAAVYQSIARRMVSYLDTSEAFKGGHQRIGGARACTE